MIGFHRETAAEEHYHVARASAFDVNVAAERGRLFAARAIIENPEQRARVEATFGIRYCQLRWPEAYRKGWWRDVLRFIPRFHPTEKD
jgi:hypothetical protein